MVEYVPPQICCGTTTNVSFNSEELNGQINQLESQITFLENKVRELNMQK